MIQKAIAIVKKDKRPLFLSSFFTVGCVVASYHPASFNSTEIFKSLALLMAVYAICKLFVQIVSTANRIEPRLEEPDEAAVVVRVFVILKEIVKASVGVCLVLVWMAGLFFFHDRFASSGLWLPTLLGIGHTLVLMVLSRLLLEIANSLHFPLEDL